MKRRIGLPRLILFAIAAVSIIAGITPPVVASDVTRLTDPPPGEHTVTVTVTTDKAVYAPGEPVRVRVQIANPLSSAQTLQFTSGYQVDYVIDDAYRWSDGRG